MGTYVIPVRAKHLAERKSVTFSGKRQKENKISSPCFSTLLDGREGLHRVRQPLSSENSRGAHSEVALNRDVGTMLRADVSVCAAAVFQPIKKRLEAKMNKLGVTY